VLTEAILVPDLRDYQIDLVQDLRVAIAKHGAVIACMPPGGGKTRVAKHILGCYLNRPKRDDESGRAAFMVHRRGLVENASNSFNEHPVLPHGLIMAGCDTSPMDSIQVASIDTKNSWYVDGNVYATDFTYDFMVWDEIHSHISKFRTFLQAHNAKREALGLRPPFILGLSATPQHEELHKVFKKIVNGPSPSWLIENGFLSPFRYFQATQGKLGLLKKSGDEYTEKSVAKAMEGLAGDLVRDWKKLADGRATVGFFPRRSHAYEAMELLRANGVNAHYVDGETSDEDRQSLFKKLNNGEIQYLCNVGVIERGTDIPRVGCVQLCTAIGSVVRYRQMVGRGSRVHPEVANCIVLDHADNIRRHGFFEDDIAWTLEWGERPAKTHESRATVECPSCGAIYRGGKCIACGYEPSQRERKSQGLEFVGGELQEIEKKEKSTKKKTCEEIMIDALYRAGKSGGSWKQAWYFAKKEAERQGTRFRVPASVEVNGARYKMIPYGNDDAKRRVRDMYGFTIGNHEGRSNPYRVE
jgi:superfamily II DNA or RNA helicase